MKNSEFKIEEKHKKFLQQLNSLDFGPLAYKLMSVSHQYTPRMRQSIGH